ncbi:MAG: response regulator [Patescibacteria group bacterium]
MNAATPARVLFIDDATPRRPLMCKLLQTHYEVMEAAEYRQAIEKVTIFAPDIIVISQNLSVLSGVALTRKLQTELKLAQPIILMGETLSNVLPADINVTRLLFPPRPEGNDPWDVKTLEERIEQLLPADKQRKAETA